MENNNTKKILVMTGGGTGGHIIPNIALIPELSKQYKIFYLGNKNSMEQNLISKFENIVFVEIPAVKFVRKFTLKNFLIPFKFIKNKNIVKKILKQINPSVIFAKGGFVSLPVVYAGKELGVPILAHESDYSMGLANKLILKKCRFMFTSFRDTCVGNKCIYSGSPIRDVVLKGNKNIAKKICGFKENLPIILIFGGSLGSKIINQFIFDNLNKFNDFNLIHIVGKNNINNIKQDNYFQIEFADNIFDFFAYCDLVICRAGSNSIFELLTIKKPMLLIPLSKKQSRGDQIENALVFKKEGYAQIIEEKDLEIDLLINKINNVLKNKDFYIKNMNKYNTKSANKIIVEYINNYSN